MVKSASKATIERQMKRFEKFKKDFSENEVKQIGFLSNKEIEEIFKLPKGQGSLIKQGWLKEGRAEIGVATKKEIAVFRDIQAEAEKELREEAKEEEIEVERDYEEEIEAAREDIQKYECPGDSEKHFVEKYKKEASGRVYRHDKIWYLNVDFKENFCDFCGIDTFYYIANDFLWNKWDYNADSQIIIAGTDYTSEIDGKQKKMKNYQIYPAKDMSARVIKGDNKLRQINDILQEIEASLRDLYSCGSTGDGKTFDIYKTRSKPRASIPGDEVHKYSMKIDRIWLKIAVVTEK